jgi:hypothetical protein
VQPLAHELFYVRAEGLLDVLTSLIEDEGFEGAVTSSFELDAVLEELGGIFECLFFLISVLEADAIRCELSQVVHGDPG